MPLQRAELSRITAAAAGSSIPPPHFGLIVRYKRSSKRHATANSWSEMFGNWSLSSPSTACRWVAYRLPAPARPTPSHRFHHGLVNTEATEVQRSWTRGANSSLVSSVPLCLGSSVPRCFFVCGTRHDSPDAHQSGFHPSYAGLPWSWIGAAKPETVPATNGMVRHHSSETRTEPRICQDV